MAEMNEAGRQWRSPDVQMLIAEARTVNTMKYARFFSDLVSSLPKESAYHLLRARMEKDPRYDGEKVTDDQVRSEYMWIVHPESME